MQSFLPASGFAMGARATGALLFSASVSLPIAGLRLRSPPRRRRRRRAGSSRALVGTAARVLDRVLRSGFMRRCLSLVCRVEGRYLGPLVIEPLLQFSKERVCVDKRYFTKSNKFYKSLFHSYGFL